MQGATWLVKILNLADTGLSLYFGQHSETERLEVSNEPLTMNLFIPYEQVAIWLVCKVRQMG